MNLELDKIEQIADKILEIYHKQLKAFKLDNSGLAKTADVEVNMNGTRLVISMKMEDYWKYVEYGRRPMQKFPPPDVIKDWITVKKIVPRPVNGKVPSTNQLAYLIGRKIARDGIPARKVLTQTVYDPEFEVVISAIREEIKRQFRQQLLAEFETTI